MNTSKFDEENVVFNYNSNLSGNVLITVPKLEEEEELIHDKTLTVPVPGEVLKAFISDWMRDKLISRTEDMDEETAIKEYMKVARDRACAIIENRWFRDALTELIRLRWSGNAVVGSVDSFVFPSENELDNLLVTDNARWYCTNACLNKVLRKVFPDPTIIKKALTDAGVIHHVSYFVMSEKTTTYYVNYNRIMQIVSDYGLH